jgi:hypothetical protein
MKLLAKFFTVLSILCISLNVIYSDLNKNQKKWQNFGKSGKYEMTYIHLFERSDQEIYQVITNTAKKNKVNIIKNDISSSDDTTKTNIYVFLANPDIHLFENLSLISGNFLNTEQMDESVSISTKENPNVIGRVFDLFEANDVEISTFKKLLDLNKSLKGDYVVKYIDKQNYYNFLDDLSQNLAVSKEELTKKTSESSIESSSIPLLSKIFLIICILLTFVSLVFYSTKKLKKIGVMKLCGWNLRSIFMNLFATILSLALIFSVVFNFFLVVFFKNVNISFILKLFSFQFLIVFLIFLTTILPIMLFKKYKISDFLNNKSPVRIALNLSFLTKQITTVLIICTSYFIPKAMREFPEQIDKMNKWNFVSKLAVVEYVGDNPNAFTGGGGDPRECLNCKKILEFLDKKGAVYVNFSKTSNLDSYRNDEKEKQIFSEFLEGETSGIKGEIRTLKVNHNYFDSFKLKDVENNVIKFDNDDNTIIVLKPKSSPISVEATKKIYDLELKEKIRGQEEFRKVKYDHNPSIEVLTYDDTNLEIPTLIEATANLGQKTCDLFEKSLFFEVIPVKLMSLGEIADIASYSGLQSSLRMDTKGKNTEEFHKDMILEFEKMNINPNDYKFRIIGDFIENEINIIKQAVKTTVCALFLLLLTIILISLQNITTYIEVHKKQIVIKKIYGWRIIDRYKTPFIFLLSGAFASISLASLIIKIQETYVVHGKIIRDLFKPLDILLLGAIFIIFDLSVCFIIVKIQEKKKLSLIVKME